MSFALILAGTVIVSIALFNRVPQVRTRPPRTSAPTAPGIRLRTAPARLTEAGRAALTTVGGSMLIIAFFLALSGL